MDAPESTVPHESIRCPASGFDPEAGVFRARCRDIVAKCTCPKYVRVLGEDPQIKGKIIAHWGCADSVQHSIGIQQGKQTYHVTEELAHLRKEMDVRDRNHEVTVKTLGKELTRAMGQVESAMDRVAAIARAATQLAAPNAARQLEHSSQE